MIVFLSIPFLVQVMVTAHIYPLFTIAHSNESSGLMWLALLKESLTLLSISRYFHSF